MNNIRKHKRSREKISQEKKNLKHKRQVLRDIPPQGQLYVTWGGIPEIRHAESFRLIALNMPIGAELQKSGQLNLSASSARICHEGRNYRDQGSQIVPPHRLEFAIRGGISETKAAKSFRLIGLNLPSGLELLWTRTIGGQG